jgi:trans-aconitate methyltransferase
MNHTEPKNMIIKAKELSRDNLEFLHLDINKIDFNEEFDIVYSNATLHWVKDHVKLLASCYRSLKSSGIIRFNFAGDGNCATFNSTVQDAMKRQEFEKYFIGFTWPWFMPKIDEYEQIIRNNNFKEIKIWEENADRFFVSSEEMIKWIDQPSLVPFLREIDEQDKSIFREIVITQMLQKAKQKDDKCFEMFRRINVMAKK